MHDPSDILIRPAILSDAMAIFTLIRNHPDDLIPRPIGDIIQNIDRFFVGEVKGRVVGCAAWKILPEIGKPERASVEIQSVAVDQASVAASSGYADRGFHPKRDPPVSARPGDRAYLRA